MFGHTPSEFWDFSKNPDVAYMFVLVPRGKRIEFDPFPPNLDVNYVHKNILREHNINNVDEFFERYPIDGKERKQIALYAQPSGSSQLIFIQSHEYNTGSAPKTSSTKAKNTMTKQNTSHRSTTLLLGNSLDEARENNANLLSQLREKDAVILQQNERIGILQQRVADAEANTHQQVSIAKEMLQRQVFDLQNQISQQANAHELTITQLRAEMERLHAERQSMIQSAYNEGYEVGKVEGETSAEQQLSDDVQQKDLYAISNPAVRALKHEYNTLSDELKRTKRKLRKLKTKQNHRSIALADTFAQYQPLLMDAVLPVIVPPLVNKGLTMLGLQPISDDRMSELQQQGEQVRQNEKLKRMLADYDNGKITREEFANETQLDPETLYVDASGIVRQRTANVVQMPPSAPKQGLYGNLNDEDTDDEEDADDEESEEEDEE